MITITREQRKELKITRGEAADIERVLDTLNAIDSQLSWIYLSHIEVSTEALEGIGYLTQDPETMLWGFTREKPELAKIPLRDEQPQDCDPQ